jgi:hypothetical protein
MSKLPKEIYVWDEDPEDEVPQLNMEADGGRPSPENDAPLRTGIYRLVREVDIIRDVKEVEVKPAVDPSSGFIRTLK